MTKSKPINLIEGTVCACLLLFAVFAVAANTSSSYLFGARPPLGSGAVVLNGPNGHGSGVWIDPTHIITAAHVIQVTKDGRFTVVGEKGKVVMASVTRVDADHDVAILTVIGDYRSPYFSPLVCRPPQVDERVTIIGAPLWLPILHTHGTVASNIFGVPDQKSLLFAIDGEVAEGNSGGPVLDSTGEVIGIVDAMPIDMGFTPTGMVPLPVFGLTLAVSSKTICEQLSTWGIDGFAG